MLRLSHNQCVCARVHKHTSNNKIQTHTVHRTHITVCKPCWIVYHILYINMHAHTQTVSPHIVPSSVCFCVCVRECVPSRKAQPSDFKSLDACKGNISSAVKHITTWPNSTAFHHTTDSISRWMRNCERIFRTHFARSAKWGAIYVCLLLYSIFYANTQQRYISNKKIHIQM